MLSHTMQEDINGRKQRVPYASVVSQYRNSHFVILLNTFPGADVHIFHKFLEVILLMLSGTGNIAWACSQNFIMGAIAPLLL